MGWDFFTGLPVLDQEAIPAPDESADFDSPASGLNQGQVPGVLFAQRFDEQIVAVGDIFFGPGIFRRLEADWCYR